MSVDEIRRLADRIETDYATAVGEQERICPEIISALLAYAAMVERCEEIKVEYPFDAVINTANYILKGANDERKD